jgi:catechol 2,3-dioxygenase-like lactoylglutathione lyase family enzyme
MRWLPPLFTGIDHVCVVTHDLDRTAAAWAERYGVGPWRVWTNDASNMSADYAMRAAMGEVASGFRVELIEPLDETSPYARADAGRVHHVRFDVADYDAARERLEAAGVTVAQEEEFDGAPGVEGRFRATYFDTEAELGLVVQIGRAPDGFEMPEPEAVVPAGVDPVFTGLNHVCVVTTDRDRAVRTWAHRYGVGPWALYSYDSSNMSAVVDGEPTDFEMRVALCNVSPAQRIELIQPLDDRSPYARSLAVHDGADHVHHLRLDVAGYDEADAGLRRLGLRRLMDAEFAGAADSEAKFVGTYYGTEDELGVIVEIGEARPGFLMAEPEEVYPS